MKEVKNIFLTLIFSLAIFVIFIFPIEYWLTEVRMSVPEISNLLGSLFLIILLLTFNLIDWAKLSKKKLIWITIVTLFASSVFVLVKFRKMKAAREYLPKIYNVDRSWGIQGQIVKIEGKNFFAGWKKGIVILGGQEMLIGSWNEETIVTEMQVPRQFGNSFLYLIRSDGKMSNKILFEIKNPNNLPQ